MVNRKGALWFWLLLLVLVLLVLLAVFVYLWIAQGSGFNLPSFGGGAPQPPALPD